MKMDVHFRYPNSTYDFSPVIFDSEEAIQKSNYLFKEVENRKKEFKRSKSKNIQEHNEKGNKLPYIVILIDEFSDLILNEKKEEFEELICALAKEGSEVGIHPILSTSRPAESIFTEKIRETFETRIAFSLTTERDSNFVIGEAGAEDLLGQGDLIFKNMRTNESIWAQSPYIDFEEVEKIVMSK
jgi:DNA segregation ATPase FtsK/SpoIIIE, S-DNA-T family